MSWVIKYPHIKRGVKMTNNFTQKEMLVRMMNKLDSIEIKLNQTHEQTFATNGKVKLHSKFIIALISGFVTLAGWLVSIALK